MKHRAFQAEYIESQRFSSLGGELMRITGQELCRADVFLE